MKFQLQGSYKNIFFYAGLYCMICQEFFNFVEICKSHDFCHGTATN